MERGQRLTPLRTSNRGTNANGRQQDQGAHQGDGEAPSHEHRVWGTLQTELQALAQAPEEIRRTRKTTMTSRSDDPETSKQAGASLDTAALEQAVLDALTVLHGATTHELS